MNFEHAANVFAVGDKDAFQCVFVDAVERVLYHLDESFSVERSLLENHPLEEVVLGHGPAVLNGVEFAGVGNVLEICEVRLDQSLRGLGNVGSGTIVEQNRLSNPRPDAFDQLPKKALKVGGIGAFAHCEDGSLC